MVKTSLQQLNFWRTLLRKTKLTNWRQIFLNDASSTRIWIFLYPQLFLSGFKSNLSVHTHPMAFGFIIEKLGLQRIGLLLDKILDAILLRYRIRKYPDSPYVKAETHDVTNRCDTSRRQVSSSALMLRQVAAIRNLFGARNRFWKRGNVN